MSENANSRASKSVRLLTLSAMFIAAITLSTAYLFHIPISSNGSYIHLGDTFIYLAACFLPMPYAVIVASVGGGLADFISGATLWIIPTMIIKPLHAVCFTTKGKLLCKRNVIALFICGITSIGGYYIAESILYGSWILPLATIWSGFVQSGGSGLFFVVIATALDKMGIRDKIKL